MEAYTAHPDDATGIARHASIAVQHGFTAVWNDLLDNAGLSIQARFLYVMLQRYAWQASECHPRQETLAATLGIKPRQLRDYVAELVNAGLVTVQRKGRGRSNSYLLHIPPVAGEQTSLNPQVTGTLLPVKEPMTGTLRPFKTGSRVPILNEKDPLEKETTADGPSGRPRDEVWDELVAVFGEPQTRGERSLRNKVLRSLREAGATALQVRRRSRHWERLYPNAHLTVTALEKHWTDLGIACGDRPAVTAPHRDVAEYERQQREARERIDRLVRDNPQRGAA